MSPTSVETIFMETDTVKELERVRYWAMCSKHVGTAF